MTQHVEHQQRELLECPLKTDPTKNVLDLVNMSIRRVDDVILANAKRTDDLANERVKRLENEQRLRAEYGDKLMLAESKRIDAIRDTDVAAATLANERAKQQADILAKQVATTADVLRTLVDATAKQMSLQHETTAKALADKISVLEKNQYEAQGKAVAISPMQDELVKEMRMSREHRNLSSGERAGMSTMWGFILSALTALSTGIAITLALQGAFRPTVAIQPSSTVSSMTSEDMEIISRAWDKIRKK